MSNRSISLILPFPVSINAYWASRVIKVKGRSMATVYVSSEGKQFQKAVADAVAEQLKGHEPLEGRLSVTLKFYQPNARVCDISNYVKTTEDAMTRACVWIDDSQIDRELLIRGPISRDRPRVEVSVSVLRNRERVLFT